MYYDDRKRTLKNLHGFVLDYQGNIVHITAGTSYESKEANAIGDQEECATG